MGKVIGIYSWRDGEIQGQCVKMQPGLIFQIEMRLFIIDNTIFFQMNFFYGKYVLILIILLIQKMFSFKNNYNEYFDRDMLLYIT